MDYLLGKTHWAIPEGYIPSDSTGPEPEMVSHETVCILNTADKEANIEIIIYFTDKDPIGPYKVMVEAQRVMHLRFNNLKDPAPIPRDTDYASVIISDVPIVVQHTRLDSRQPSNALLSTIAYAAN